MVPTPLINLDAAKALYEAYTQVTDWKNFRGDPMPQFEALPDTIKTSWAAADDKSLARRMPPEALSDREWSQIHFAMKYRGIFRTPVFPAIRCCC